MLNVGPVAGRTALSTPRSALAPCSKAPSSWISTPLPIGQRSIVMTVSVCLSVSCVYVCRPAIISPEIHVRSLPFFAHVTCCGGLILLWRRRDTLCTSGFMGDVILAHKARQLNVSAHLMEAQPTCSLGLGYKRRVGIPLRVSGLALTGLLFGRRAVWAY